MAWGGELSKAHQLVTGVPRVLTVEILPDWNHRIEITVELVEAKSCCVFSEIKVRYQWRITLKRNVKPYRLNHLCFLYIKGIFLLFSQEVQLNFLRQTSQNFF